MDWDGLKTNGTSKYVPRGVRGERPGSQGKASAMDFFENSQNAGLDNISGTRYKKERALSYEGIVAVELLM